MGHQMPSDPNRITVGIDEADKMFCKMPLDYEKPLDSLAGILKSDGFTDFGTIVFDNAITEDINFNTYGNTTVKKFTQSGNRRNMDVMDFLPTDWLLPWFYRMYFYPCQEFGVTINDLSGTNLLSIMGGKVIEPDIYGANNKKVYIKTSKEIGKFDALQEREKRENYYVEQYLHKLLLDAYDKPYDETTWNALHWGEPAKIENKNVWKWYTVILTPGCNSYGLHIVGAEISADGWFFYHENDKAVVPFSYAVDYYLSQKLKQEGKLPVVDQSSGGEGDQNEQDQPTELQIEEEEEEIDDDPSNQDDQNEQHQQVVAPANKGTDNNDDQETNNNSQKENVRLDLNTTIGHLNKIRQLAEQFNKNGAIFMPDVTGARSVANAGTEKADKKNKEQDNK